MEFIPAPQNCGLSKKPSWLYTLERFSIFSRFPPLYWRGVQENTSEWQ